MPKLTSHAVYLVDGSRTPFLKAVATQGPFSASDLALQTARALLMRQVFLPSDIDEVIAGCMIPAANEANIGRIVALRLGCGAKTPGWTVQRNCASGMQAIDSACQRIAAGRANLILAGGMDAMSRAPLQFHPSMANWLGQWLSSKSWAERARVLLKFRPHFFTPLMTLLQGLTDPIVGLSMGQTAENLAYRFNLTREQMDGFALMSHQRVTHAQQLGLLSEITPIYDNQGKAYIADDGVRPDSSLAKLAKLKPFFDRQFGSVTAGNSSQITDGAAFVLLASAQAVKRWDLRVLARIVDVEWAALDPAQMGLGPVHAVTPLLQRHQLSLDQIDYWEINEAFAAQVLACLAAWEDEHYCRTQLGLKQALGRVDSARLNIDGGAIALGHPIGASGARIVYHLARVLERTQAKRGIAAICIGGGQGGAMLLERGSED